jgi:hypothetical protein
VEGILNPTSEMGNIAGALMFFGQRFSAYQSSDHAGIQGCVIGVLNQGIRLGMQSDLEWRLGLLQNLALFAD